MSMDSLDQLLTMAEGKIRSVEERIQQIELIDFPSKNPRILISMFRRVLQALSKRLDGYQKEFAEETDIDIRARIRSEVQGIAYLVIQHIAAHLRYIEGASFY